MPTDITCTSKVERKAVSSAVPSNDAGSYQFCYAPCAKCARPAENPQDCAEIYEDVKRVYGERTVTRMR